MIEMNKMKILTGSLTIVPFLFFSKTRKQLRKTLGKRLFTF